ncbi:annexin D5-like isoform X1 [Nicotiana tabacum]|uniref:Annexin n=3 Tax=Nicotiana tabacum TaxID=4097 RepID=A0A1S4D0N5_TOBAC|nr:PREDICTED: annexin D5-like isoform X1 [Nicotiana tabacum]
MATLIIPPVLTSPRDDAMQLYKAFKGFGCDTGSVINILAHRDATQRALIQQEYKVMYSEELNNRLSKELSGDTKRAFLLWMHDPPGRDATVVRQALSGDLRAATEVICSRTPSQIQYFKQIYYTMYGVYLEQDIESRASDDHKKLLLSYVRTIRYEGPEVDSVMAERDAKALYKAGENRWGTDEKTFIRIFCESSSAHLAAVSYAYQSKYKNKLKKAVKSETSGLFRFALLTILRCAKNPARYFAKQLHKAMKGLGTNDATLIRIIITRAEIDMQYIKAEYRKKYKKCLNDAVYSETSGNYRTFLLDLLGPNY